MSAGEFERAYGGETGRRMDVATHNARHWEGVRDGVLQRPIAQAWRDSRWSSLNNHLANRRWQA